MWRWGGSWEVDGGEEEDKEHAAPRRVNVRRKQEEKGFSRLPQGVSTPMMAPPPSLGSEALAGCG